MLAVIWLVACAMIKNGVNIDSIVDVCVSLTAGNTILCLYPLSYEDTRYSKWAVAIFCAALVGLGLSPFDSRTMLLAVTSLSAVMMFVLQMIVFYRKFSRVRALFQCEAVWHRVEDDVRANFSCLLCLLGIMQLVLPGSGRFFAAQLLLLALLLSLFVVQYIRAYTGRTVLLSRRTEDKVKELVNSSLRTVVGEDPSQRDRMNTIYSRIIKYIKEAKPFLDEYFTIQDLAKEIGVNRVYISHIINVCSGRNFKQFLNYHRVEYAMALMKKEPSLKIMDVAIMSGFHTVVSFNMAFKANTGSTPGEYKANSRFT